MSLEGEIGEIDLIERLVELGRENFTGAIRFENDGIIKIIYFKGGDILSASTNDRSDSVDEILLRAGKVTREHVKQALAKRKESETLGDALLILGFITRKELTWGRRVQVIGVIRSVAAWQTGSFTIVSDYLPKREEGTLFPLRQILLELIVTEQDRPKFDQAMDAGEAVFAKSPTFATDFAALGLNDEAEQIVSFVDGRRNAAEVATGSGKDTFNVYKLLHALRVLGLLSKAASTHPVSEFALDTHDDLASAGVADAADMWGRPEPPSYQFDDEVSAGPDLPMAVMEPVIEQTAAMPSWEAPPSARTIATMLPASSRLDLPSEPAEGWGFDEAQIETSKRGAGQGRGGKQAAEEPRRRGLLVPLIVLLILAAAGYGGWLWWQGQQVRSQQAQAIQPRPRRPIPTPDASGASTTQTMPVTVIPTTASTPMSTSTTGAPSTGTTTSASALSTTGTTTTPLTITPPERTHQTTGTPSGPVKPGVPPVTTATTQGTVSSASQPAPTGRSSVPARSASTTPPAPAPASGRSTTTGGATTRIERSGTSAVITNGGASPSTGSSTNDASRSRYDAMAEANAHGAAGKFTIQFELVCESASIRKALTAGGSDVWFVPVSYRGKSCYRVFWGHYETRGAANAAISQIPASLREAVPVVVSVPK
jgi:hypothetical protein